MSGKRAGLAEGSINYRTAYDWTDKQGQVHHQPAVWVIRVSLGKAGAKRLRRIYYAKSESEAKVKLREALVRKYRGELPGGGRLKVDAYLRTWLERRRLDDSIRPKTYTFYRQAIEHHLAPGLSNYYLDSLKADDVGAMLGSARSKAGGPLSPRTKAHLRAILANALKDAQRGNRVIFNAAELSKPIRTSRPEALVWDAEQAQRFLATVRGPLGALYTLALYLGLRQGELLGLQWEDIDFKARTITIRRTLRVMEVIDGPRRSKPKWTVATSDPKSETSKRVLPVPDAIIDVLQEHRRQTIERLQRLPGPWVFCTGNNTPYWARFVVKDFKRQTAKAGLPEIRFHDLRHSCNSILAAEGVDADTRKKILGHSDIRLTQNLYTHVVPASMRRAVEKMGRLLTLPSPAATRPG